MAISALEMRLPACKYRQPRLQCAVDFTHMHWRRNKLEGPSFLTTPLILTLEGLMHLHVADDMPSAITYIVIIAMSAIMRMSARLEG